MTLVKPLRRQQQRVLSVLTDRPGLNIDELSASLGLRRTAINHHVRVLLRSGLVVRLRQGRHALHFTSGTSPCQRAAFCALRIPGVSALCRDAFDHPCDALSSRSERLGLSRRHVRRAFKMLVKQGLATSKPGLDHAVTIHLHPDLRILIVRAGGGTANGAGRAPSGADLP